MFKLQKFLKLICHYIPNKGVFFTSLCTVLEISFQKKKPMRLILSKLTEFHNHVNDSDLCENRCVWYKLLLQHHN